jgi:hypothetical protein
MILLRILEHDLHRAKRGLSAVPFMIEVPARPGFVPAIISTTRGKFIVADKLVDDGFIRVGIFKYDSDRLDEVVSDLFDSAYILSRDSEWNNIFVGDGAAELAFDYIGEQSGMPGAQPHACLIPESWTYDRTQEFLGEDYDGRKYKKICHVVSAQVTMPIFCSRPDMVGMYTQFMGGNSGIVLHNVRLGLAFCAPSGGS